MALHWCYWYHRLMTCWKKKNYFYNYNIIYLIWLVLELLLKFWKKNLQKIKIKLPLLSTLHIWQRHNSFWHNMIVFTDTKSWQNQWISNNRCVVNSRYKQHVWTYIICSLWPEFILKKKKSVENLNLMQNYLFVITDNLL